MGTGFGSGLKGNVNQVWINTVGYAFLAKYRLTYSYAYNVSPAFIGFNSACHEIALSFLLIKRDL